MAVLPMPGVGVAVYVPSLAGDESRGLQAQDRVDRLLDRAIAVAGRLDCRNNGEEQIWGFAMNVYETISTVEDHGQVRVAGVPFAPGAEVEVTICPKVHSNAPAPSDAAKLKAARERMPELFGIVKGFRNSPRTPREELHERPSLR